MPIEARRTIEADASDANLVERTAAGDRIAFEALMRRHNRRLCRLARAALRDDAEAEEALQDAYLAAHRSIGAFRGEASLATWLSRLVINECLDRLRRQQRRASIAPTVSTEDPAHEVAVMRLAANDDAAPDRALIRAETRALIERKVDELPEAYRTVFVLRCVEELSVEETAQCLDIPEATVRTRQFRARGLLRDSLALELDLTERDVFEFGGGRCDRIVARVLTRLA